MLVPVQRPQSPPGTGRARAKAPIASPPRPAHHAQELLPPPAALRPLLSRRAVHLFSCVISSVIHPSMQTNPPARLPRPPSHPQQELGAASDWHQLPPPASPGGLSHFRWRRGFHVMTLVPVWRNFLHVGCIAVLALAPTQALKPFAK